MSTDALGPDALSAHHAATLQRTQEHFARDPSVLGLVLAGSLAHGFAAPSSDVDVMIVVSDEERRQRLVARQSTFFSTELCTYPGYVDGKFISEGFLRDVAERGSEPARFAFQDARVLFSRSASLPAALQAAARYPSAEREERMRRFQAQIEAWRWYTTEAGKRRDMLLMRLAVAKLSLFCGRLVLAHNQLLYPYHKWFLRVLASAPQQPPGLVPLLVELAEAPDAGGIDGMAEKVERLVSLVRGFGSWTITPSTWSPQFMLDSELNWLEHPPPIDDL